MFTAKEQGLWTPTNKVSAEDVCHLRNRVQEFRLLHTITTLQEVDSCAPCMARWIIKYSGEAAAGPVPRPLTCGDLAPPRAPVRGFAETMAAAKIGGPTSDGLLSDVTELGAVDINELTLEDWERLPSFALLRPLEMCRLIAIVSPVAAKLEP